MGGTQAEAAQQHSTGVRPCLLLTNLCGRSKQLTANSPAVLTSSCATHDKKWVCMHARATHQLCCNNIAALQQDPLTRTLIGRCWCLLLRNGRMRRSSCSPGRLLGAACGGAPAASATPTHATGDAIALTQRVQCCFPACVARHSEQLSLAPWALQDSTRHLLRARQQEAGRGVSVQVQERMASPLLLFAGRQPVKPGPT